MKIARMIILLLTILMVGIGDAARRSRSTTPPTTSASFESRQLGFSGQPEELENLWEHIDLQKLDNSRSQSWTNEPATSSSTENVEIYENDPNSLSTGRQFYPGLPGNPGETGEVPSPILPPLIPLPTPAPGCLARRGQFSSPRNCANYLNCWDDVVIEQSCPGGLLFNDYTNVCDFDYNVHCGSRPAPTPKPPLPPGSKYCPDPNGRYRSATNCSEFYVCLIGKPIKFSCPRRLVYNDILNVCDYPHNVDCKGSATPKPLPPTPPPTEPPTYPSYPHYPSYPSDQTYYPPQPEEPPYVPPQPSYPPQKPPYIPPPTFPPYQTSYPGNPWLSKVEPDPWHQRPVATQLEVEADNHKQNPSNTQDHVGSQADVPVTPTVQNPWTLSQDFLSTLANKPCKDGDVHRLNHACTTVVVCRNGHPHKVECKSGLTYDRPSDSCRPFTVAKC